jgi:hypothetical protein
LEQLDPIGHEFLPWCQECQIYHRVRISNISCTTWGHESNSFHLHFYNKRLGVNQFYTVQLRSTSLKDMAAIKIAESITEPGDVEKFELPTLLPAFVRGWFEWLNATLDD